MLRMYNGDDVEHFAGGMSEIMDVEMKVRKDRKKGPRTDGETVYYDPSGEGNFTWLQSKSGTMVHEMAHVRYDTVTSLLPKDGDRAPDVIADELGRPAAAAMVQGVMNAIVDVVDETTVQTEFPATEDLLLTSNGTAWQQIGQDLPGNEQSLVASKPWDALSLGILGACNKHGEVAGNYRQKDTDRMVEAVTAHLDKRLGRGVTQGVIDMVKQLQQEIKDHPEEWINRTEEQWQEVRDVTKTAVEAIWKILPEDDEELPKGGGGSPGDGDEEGDANGKPGEGDGDEDTSSPVKDAADQANDGEPIGQSPFVEYRTDPAESGNSEAIEGSGCYFDDASYYRYLADLQKVIPVISETNAAMNPDVLTDDGDHIVAGNWPNVFTDQVIFGHPDQETGEELNLAIMMDISGSMDGIIQYTAALSRAFCCCADQAGARIHVETFGWNTHTIPWQDLHKISELEGCTEGAQAAKKCSDWLCSQASGRRVLLVITDGGLGDRDQTISEFTNLIHNQGEVYIIGINITLEALAHGWGGGLEFAAVDHANVGQLADWMVDHCRGGL